MSYYCHFKKEIRGENLCVTLWRIFSSSKRVRIAQIYGNLERNTIYGKLNYGDHSGLVELCLLGFLYHSPWDPFSTTTGCMERVNILYITNFLRASLIIFLYFMSVNQKRNIADNWITGVYRTKPIVYLTFSTMCTYLHLYIYTLVYTFFPKYVNNRIIHDFKLLELVDLQ